MQRYSVYIVAELGELMATNTYTQRSRLKDVEYIRVSPKPRWKTEGIASNGFDGTYLEADARAKILIDDIKRWGQMPLQEMKYEL